MFDTYSDQYNNTTIYKPTQTAVYNTDFDGVLGRVIQIGASQCDPDSRYYSQ